MAVTLGGVALSGHAPVQWALTTGVLPWVTEVETITARARAIPVGRPLTLRLEDRTFNNVYVRSRLPGRRPTTTRLELVDQRWRWTRKYVVFDANLRRRTGERRVIGEARIDTRPLALDVEYYEHSLRSKGQLWDPKAALLEVFRQLGHGPGNLPLVQELPTVDLRDVIIDAPGPAALVQLLKYLPGLDVALQADGRPYTVLVYDRSEGDQLPARPLQVVSASQVETVNLASVRPRWVNVLYTPEVELKFTYDEDRTAAYPQDSEELALENVLPVPDPSLTVGGRTVGAGTWVTIQEAIAAWNPSRPAQVLNLPLSMGLLREHATSGFRHLEWAGYVRTAAGAPDQVWTQRFQALRRHFRHTYRPIEAWRARLLHLLPFRFGVIDVETGARAPAQVYADYVVKPTFKGLVEGAPGRVNHGWQVRGYNAQLSRALAGPWTVQVLDEQALVFRLRTHLDPLGQADAIMPGFPEDETRQVRLNAASMNGGAPEAFGLWSHYKLARGFKLAVVLSGVPAAPNDQRRLFRDVSFAAAVADRLPGGVPANGPPVTVRVSPGLITAKFEWLDRFEEVLKNAMLGRRAWGDALPALFNLFAINDVTDAITVVTLEPNVDRLAGEGLVFAGHGVQAQPAGALSHVSYTKHTDGRFMAQLHLPERLVPRNFDAYLSAGTRALLQREVTRRTR